jgi:glucose-6-phosphate isomerase
MIDLSDRAGFPLKFDPGTLEVMFSSDMAETLHSSRSVEDMVPVLQSACVPDNAPELLYHMYRDVHYPGCSLKETHGLRYDLSVFRPGFLGLEYMKSLGHYHPLVPGMGASYPEVYEVLHGEAVFLMQKVSATHPDIVEDFMICTVRAGEKIVMPPDYGHVTVNCGAEPLITVNWVSDRFRSLYAPVARKRGFAWYLESCDDGKFSITPNDLYNDGCPPTPEFVGISSSHAIMRALSNDPLFSVGMRTPEKLLFLNDPRGIDRGVFAGVSAIHVDNESAPVIAVDFDGTIAEFTEWRGLEHMGEPIVDENGLSAVDFMHVLRSRGYKIIVWTCRGDRNLLAEWLEKYGVPYDEINNNVHDLSDCSSKVAAECYVDDRALRFNGSYKDILSQLPIRPECTIIS